MKKLIVAALLSSLPAAALAQDGPPARPPAPTFGLGVGITAPTDSLAPNTASIRARLTDSITLEPEISFASNKGTTTVKIQQQSSESEDESGSVSVGTSLRYAFADRGRVDALGIVGVGFTSADSTNNPDGEDNNTITESSEIYFQAGIGLEHWIHPHWSLSMDGSLLSYASRDAETEDQASNATTTSENTALRFTTSPVIRFMGHLYF